MIAVEEQLELIAQLSIYYAEIPFKDKPIDKLRYWFYNSYYSYTDGIVLHTMIRHLKPKRIMSVIITPKRIFRIILILWKVIKIE